MLIRFKYNDIILVIIMAVKKQDVDVEIDWDELDNFWASQYEADYGNYFSEYTSCRIAESAYIQHAV